MISIFKDIGIKTNIGWTIVSNIEKQIKHKICYIPFMYSKKMYTICSKADRKT